MSASKGYYRDELVKLIKEAEADGVRIHADWEEISVHNPGEPSLCDALIIYLDDLDAPA